MSSFAPTPPPGGPQQPYGQPVAPQGPPPPVYGPPPGFTGPPAPAKGAKKHWKAPTFIGVGAFVFGLILGGAGGGSEDPAPTETVTAEAEDVNVTQTEEYRALAEEKDKIRAERDELEDQIVAMQEEAAAAEAEAEAPAGLTNGSYIVGDTMEAGRYTMVTDGALGYVDQQDGDDYLAQEVANDGETIVVDIADVPGSIVTFSGVTGIEKVE